MPITPTVRLINTSLYSENHKSTPYTYPYGDGTWTLTDYQNALNNPAYYDTWGKTQLSILQPDNNATVMKLPDIVDPLSYTIKPFMIYQDQNVTGYDVSSLASSVGLNYRRILAPGEAIAIPYSGNKIFYAKLVPIDRSRDNVMSASAAGYNVTQDVSVTYSDIVTEVQNLMGITFNTDHMKVNND